MTTTERPQPVTMQDVEWALLRVCQAAEVVKTLNPTNMDAKALDQKATGLLKLVQLRAWAAADEVLGDVASSARRCLPEGEVGKLLATSIDTADATLAEFIEQEAKLGARRRMIDEGDHL